MSRFAPCRETTLEGVVKDCAGKCMNRGVRGGCPCLIVTQTTFPTVDANSSQMGPGGNEVPMLNPSQSRFPFFSNNGAANMPVFGHTGFSGDPGDRIMSTASPPAGSTYSIDQLVPFGLSLVPVGGFSCPPLFAFYYTSKAEQGDVVAVSFQSKKSGNYLSKIVNPTVHIMWRSANGFQIGAGHFFIGSVLTTSYVTRSTSGVAPATTAYATVSFNRNEGGPGGFGGDAIYHIGDVQYSLS